MKANGLCLCVLGVLCGDSAQLIGAEIALIARSDVAAADDLERSARDAVAAKRFREAATLYAQLWEREPANRDYLVWIGRLSSWTGNYETALEAYDRALARAPQDVEALVGKASVLLWLQKFPEAYRELVQAERLAPASVDVQLVFARYYHYQRQERPADARVRLALALDPANHEARDLLLQIVVPRAIQLRTGYGLDDFSFARESRMGYVSAGYSGAGGDIAVQYERWEKFGERVDRAGLTFSRRLRGGASVRGGVMAAPNATVIAQEEYTAGFSRPWRRGAVIGADYRQVNFADVRVHVASPSLEYYFVNRPAWAQAVWSHSWTDFDTQAAVRAHNDSLLLRYNEPIGRTLVVSVGYARGNESFAALSIDRIGRFGANTYMGAVDLRVTSRCSIGLSFADQRRSSGTRQRTFATTLSLRQ
jgi:YaiO family outer membrane protein